MLCLTQRVQLNETIAEVQPRDEWGVGGGKDHAINVMDDVDQCRKGSPRPCVRCV